MFSTKSFVVTAFLMLSAVNAFSQAKWDVNCFFASTGLSIIGSNKETASFTGNPEFEVYFVKKDTCLIVHDLTSPGMAWVSQQLSDVQKNNKKIYYFINNSRPRVQGLWYPWGVYPSVDAQKNVVQFHMYSTDKIILRIQ